jgi:hypothetical protein
MFSEAVLDHSTITFSGEKAGNAILVHLIIIPYRKIASVRSILHIKIIHKNPSQEAVTNRTDLLCYVLFPEEISPHGKIPSPMKQWFTRKSFPLVVGIFSIVLLIFLISGLDSLEFRKGVKFTYVEANNSGELRAPEPPDMQWAVIITVVVIAILTILTLIVASPKQRRILLIILLAMVLVFLGIMWWISIAEPSEDSVQPTRTMLQTPASFPEPKIPIGTEQPAEIYTPPKISSWISIGITFTILLLAVLFGWVFLRNRWRDDVSLEALAGIAEQAVSDLESGKDYDDVVINCYAKMVKAVNKQRGIRRSGNLTPEEFIAVLERAHLPSVPVRHLTALFERVRYGGKTASKTEIGEAVTFLTEIVATIREIQ